MDPKDRTSTSNRWYRIHQHIRMLLGQMAVLSGVPDYVFGSQVSRRSPEFERILFTAQTKRSTPSAVN